MPIRVEYLSGAAAVHPDVDAAWRQLYRADPDVSFASGPEFSAFIMATFGVQGTPATLLVWADEQLQLVWPLSIHPVGWSRLPTRQLRHRNGWHTTYGNPVFASTARTIDASVVAKAIRQFPDCDSLNLWRLRAEPRLVGLEAPPSQLTVVPDRILDLSTSHELPGKFRRELFRCRKRLSEAGELRVEWLEGVDLAKVGNAFAELHTRLKAHQRQWQVFADFPGSADRLGSALARVGAAGHAAAIHVAVDGISRGLLIFWHDKGSVLTWRSAWDPDWKGFGVGAQLLWEAREWAVAHHAREVRLAPGAEPYKQHWANRVDTVTRVQYDAGSWTGRTRRALHRWMSR